MAGNKSLQRLYLAKGEEEDSNVYVDTICLPQHQCDGIRFLYRQFKKGKAGVILNDPPGYGKRVQTVLFLNAMRSVKVLPTLVLCAEGIEEVWIQQFRQWTNMQPDVSVQKGNEYTKSMCVIGNFSQIGLLSRRDWGVLVVDDNNVSREVLRAGINAKYKIWITSFDMKKYLQTFSLIYKWLYPKDKFNVEEFQADKKPSALLAKSVRLDAYMEDIVIRRRDVAVPLGKPCERTPDRQVSRKNKDSTGKKIKRTKRLPDHDTSTESQETASIHDSSGESDKNGKVQGKKENTEEFVVNIESIGEKKTTMFDTDKESNNTEAMDVDVNLDNTPESDAGEASYILNSDLIDSQSLIIRYDSETQDYEVDNYVPAKKSKVTNEINVSEDFFPTDAENESVKENNIEANTKADEDEKYSEYVFSTGLSPSDEMN